MKLPFRCWGLKPGLLRPARMLNTRIDICLRTLKANAIRSIWPPCNKQYEISYKDMLLKYHPVATAIKFYCSCTPLPD
jgi:hypothetical protein